MGNKKEENKSGCWKKGLSSTALIILLLGLTVALLKEIISVEVFLAIVTVWFVVIVFISLGVETITKVAAGVFSIERNVEAAEEMRDEIEKIRDNIKSTEEALKITAQALIKTRDGQKVTADTLVSSIANASASIKLLHRITAYMWMYGKWNPAIEPALTALFRTFTERYDAQSLDDIRKEYEESLADAGIQYMSDDLG